MNVRVLKFGSSVLSNIDAFWDAAHEIDRSVRKGRLVLAVVSAVGERTDQLLNTAATFDALSNQDALATLLTTGESESVSLLALALQRVGIPSIHLLPHQIELRTQGRRLDSHLVSVAIDRIVSAFKNVNVVIVPGFFGVDEFGHASLLGRGGSDLTALFLAEKLKAPCCLFKDVDGVFEADPSGPGPKPRCYESLSFDSCRRIPGEILQAKAREFAEANHLEFEVRSLSTRSGTRVGLLRDVFYPPRAPRRRLRVALLGFGNVGRRVFERLSRVPSSFEVVGVARRQVGTESMKAPIALDAHALIDLRPDVLIELIGGIDAAQSAIERALDRGIHVITANKKLIAHDGARLTNLARDSGVSLHVSASVGGSVPMIDAVLRISEEHTIVSLEGILNGTTNWVLGRVLDGLTLKDALLEAQSLGMAEAEASDDIDGIDSARKLRILSRFAFGSDLSLDDITVKGIESLDESSIRSPELEGMRLKLVARAERVRDTLQASVLPQTLDKSHPLSSCTGADNELIITTEEGLCFCIRGVGAGGVQTAQSILADLDKVFHDFAPEISEPSSIPSDEGVRT